MTGNEMSHHVFLARIGVLGAGRRLLPQCLGPGASAGSVVELGLGSLVDRIRPVLGQLARDTLNGFVAYVVPGSDDYSRAQGTLRPESGGIDASGTEFLIENLDRFVPVRNDLVRPAASALVTALAGLPLPLPDGLLGSALVSPSIAIDMVEDAVLFLVENDRATPLSLPVALLLNYVATMVNPASLDGEFLSPFARLSSAHKARALEMLETSQSELAALIDTQVPEPLKRSVAGLLQFLGGALHEFAAFGSIGDNPQLDPVARTLIGRPVGWPITGIAADLMTGDSWDDVLGLYQDRYELREA
jgi:hypothetical protein